MPPGSLPRHPAAPAAQLQAATPETSQAKVLRTQGCSLDAHGWLSGGSSVRWRELCPVGGALSSAHSEAAAFLLRA